MKIYNKLVRDNIPKIIENDGKKYKSRILNDEEYEVELRKKLIEEATELSEAKTEEEKIYELADIYEIIEYVLMVNNIDKRKLCVSKKI
jgi:predicted house-cleaning noncanonical NTP pyrophosphatase (MazG superfamily)